MGFRVVPSPGFQPGGASQLIDVAFSPPRDPPFLVAHFFQAPEILKVGLRHVNLKSLPEPLYTPVTEPSSLPAEAC